MSCLKPALALLLALITLPGAARAADTPAQPYQITVWADVQFDESGKVAKVDFAQKDQLPAAFMQFLGGKVSAYAIEPRMDGAAAVAFESGVRVQVEIRPAAAGSSAAILGMKEMPRPVKADQGSPIRMRLKGEWAGSFLVRCHVGLNGRCGKPEVDASANVPAEMQRVIKSIAAAWRFVPQKLAGKAVEGDYETMIEIESDTTAPPESFDKRI